MSNSKDEKKRSFFSKNKGILLTILIFAVLVFYPLPYYITSPGDAMVLDPIIKVEGGDEDKGEFMLLTVAVGKANIPQYIWAKFSDYKEVIPANQIRSDEETDEEYNQRQLQMMEDSQHAATVVAFQSAGKKVDIKYHGVYVTGIMEGMPAEGKLKVADKIIAVDHKSVMTTKELLDVLGPKKAGEKVDLTVLRGEKKMNVNLNVEQFPKKYIQNEGPKAGLGITSPVTDVSIATDPSIKINTSQIGGPSAGLMFTLEIMDQLLDKDMTHGKKIAGTGTMDLEKNVGPIGGIQQKVVAAEDAGAEIFFAPVAGDNYKDALKAKKDIGSKMKIVPVKTLDDALNYLNKL
ncbi:SepM family pheromone-processing serine protease [Bacillus sp. NEB1478]|uniref:SepM family pheromone-processing serine protease n=1 Tax=Bacillus sp. NEB1478 TaxID=3073816 RepID=UPI0028732A4A|nr:SepM family pheromone-processing serine protease [Bacillus sp. NEB1478]WNB90507.1 SepM family pheromone-processing serine protease [Bacillus sp. NEB1478]